MWTFLKSVDVGAPTNVQRLLLFVVDVYNTPAIDLVFDERQFDFVSGFINYIHSRKLHIQNLKISSTIVEDEIVGFVLDNCRAASEVHLNCPTTPGFDYLKKTPTPKFSLDKLTINYAEWVTTRHLTNLFINCKHVILDGCDSKNLKIKQFIKKWVYEYSQLKYASLTFDYVDFSMNDIMRRIPSKRVPTRTTSE
ncbi:hypothetical protein GCK72_025970 [Caenorhabditis remanei]|uniref:Sdz-33 F-box domain-containing protein n=1 Tax=Caenorhabditis remanei TaxID=31234 RepID=A0A6A5G485_CAERE|nr:hypothetical protein GCK72_025970 [Caenorhabditis remanei]KAF1749502.1 hypothetical protein GCK72_025970 [Caenorhabditis remanei]